MADEELTIDDYKLVNCIATGSSSQVWEVQDKGTNERYAMKLLLPEAFEDPAQKAVLRNEARICKMFDHPNIIRMHLHKQTRSHAYCIMDYFGGPNTKQLIRTNLLFIHTRFRRFAECVAMALGHVHDKGWVHKDVKPDNIMLSRASEVRLIDFSLAAKAPSALGKMLGGKQKVIQGTRTYIAPEVIRRKTPTPISDIYSFGITLFECLTGRPPFMGGTPSDLLIKHIQEKAPYPSEIHSNVSPDMDAFIDKLLSKKPENRPQNIGEVISELRNVKIFNVDPQEFAEQQEARRKADEEDSVSNRLSSRMDAERAEREGRKPGERKRPATPPPKPPEQKKPAAAQASPPQQPATHQQPAQPQMPQAPYGQPQPPTYQPAPQYQYPPQGMPPAAGYYPQQQYPGQPGYPQQPGMPPMQQPGAQQPAPPAQQPNQLPPVEGFVPKEMADKSQEPPKDDAKAKKPGGPKIVTSPDDADEDLPIATELPDIL